MARSTSDSARAYAVGIVVVLFLVVWATVAGRPWAGPTAVAPRDPRMAALDRWEAHLQRRAKMVQRTVDRRWARYQTRLRERIAADGRLRMPAGATRRAGPPVTTVRAGTAVVWAKAS
ncbi:MAG: hypothetical protein U0Y82_11235 [Thermoleophilia bacterium]